MTANSDAELVQAARNARSHAYAPYSNFPVGAAVLTAEGRVIVGCNVENAAYSPTICAERGAVAAARASGAGQITTIAIVNRAGTPCPPCGLCRQVLWEVAPDAIVVMEDGKGGTIQKPLRELLPMAFGPESLETR